jgi:hypothetical protein
MNVAVWMHEAMDGWMDENVGGLRSLDLLRLLCRDPLRQPVCPAAEPLATHPANFICQRANLGLGITQLASSSTALQLISDTRLLS